MKIRDLFIIKRPNTTSRQFFDRKNGTLCVHYGDIYRNYSYRTINSSSIINRFINPIDESKLIKNDSIILPDVTETISDFGHVSYFHHVCDYINGTHSLAIIPKKDNILDLKYLFYYFQSINNQKRLQALLSGSTVFQLTRKDLENFELIGYHKTCEQQHIVDTRRINV